MKPEEQTEIILWDWLKTKSKYVKEIYFNRINLLGCKTFTTTGVNKKPDFIISIDRGYGLEYIAVEIKDNSKSAQVYDSNKILMYYDNYITGKTKYFINNEEIKITHFVVATQSSPDGGLLKKESERGLLIDNIKDTNDDQWRKTLAQCGTEPRYEWAGTSQFQRNLFALFRQYRKENKLIKGSSIGIIISKVYEDGTTKKEPYLFIMNYNKHLIKPKWGCRYWEI